MLRAGFTRDSSRCAIAGSKGFSLIEVLVAIAVVASLLAIAIPRYIQYQIQARNAQAIADIRTIDLAVQIYRRTNNVYPTTLSQLTGIPTKDPWGTAYQYLKIEDEVGITGKTRKDQFLVPLNADYDLYSKGADKLTATPVQAGVSWDDLLRANEGRFIGVAANY